MKSIEIDERSWHYRFMESVDSKPWKATDFCAYTRMFLWCCLKAIFMIVALFTILGTFLFCLFGMFTLFGSLFLTMLGIYSSINTVPIGIIAALVGMVGLFIMIVAIIGVIVLVSKVRSNTRPSVPKEPGFLKLWFRSVKDKTCHKIEFTK